MPGAGAEVDGDFAELLDVLGRRWTPRLIWELRDGSLHFTELRKRAGGLSQSVLVTRLGELTQAGLVGDVNGSYELTPRGDAVAGRLRELAHGTPGEPGAALEPPAVEQPAVVQPPAVEQPAAEPPADASAAVEPAVVEPPVAQPPLPRPSPGTRPRPRPHS